MITYLYNDHIYKMNITDIDIYVEVENHPYATVIVILLFLFVLGIITAFFGNVQRGARVLATGAYYLTAPLHMPIRWAYQRI